MTDVSLDRPESETFRRAEHEVPWWTNIAPHQRLTYAVGGQQPDDRPRNGYSTELTQTNVIGERQSVTGSTFGKRILRAFAQALT